MTEQNALRSGDYLWDRSGEPEADLLRLERLLGSVREHCPIPRLELPRGVSPTRRSRVVGPVAFAVAATAILVAGGAALRVFMTPWTVSSVEGVVRLEHQAIMAPTPVRGGQVIETSEHSRALLQVGVIGHVEIDSGSRVRVIRTNRREHRLALDRGRVSAVIDAPPRWFIVDTPAAAAIDFGCAYTLEVDSAGHGTLRVQEGWVQLDGGAYEAMVPEGAMAHMQRGRGPGSPHYQDVDDAFRQALSNVDFGTDDDVESALPVVLREARSRDSLTLLSLLRRLGNAHRAEVYDRLAVLLPPPAEVTRERIVRGDEQAIDRWWKALALPRPRKLLPRLWSAGS